ncbi:MerR family transcriptional regulator [Dermatobacter hominis]|uniref:MerR family transcriptional regulator n=1 Tax=Dermatobacter hominis TaxID=2884263 RepID=UPI001D10411D|nr:MerR family transcriptional regulator [Dermatobacter hominis]UDY36338.1 MerR family transcriptional regulator [Dermatobacter hominis]
MGEDPLLQTTSGATAATGVSVAAEHLPIGEVLALLQEEFPDVTISKIRFLESQGLIQPERTASGYRRFSASDIERLQWILRQQRDHFLPLKVIRKMLDEGVDRYDPGGGAQPTLFSASVEAQADAEEGPDDDAEDAADADAPAPDPAARRRSPAHPAVASAPPRREAPRPAERTPVRSGGTAPPPAAARPQPSPPPSPSRRPVETEPPAATQETPPADAPPAEEPAAARPPLETPADVVAALQEDPRPQRRPDPRPSRAADRPVRRREPAESVSAETQLTGEELCTTAGIEPALLVELERFGLVQAVARVGERVYGPSALEVARLAARYAEHGVEPRHLRMYLVAAEREAGMVEQLAVPLLKQRNPKAREHASELASELAELGADLHRSLLRRELGHDLLG